MSFQNCKGWARFLTRAHVSQSARNKDNLTALLLACKLGNAKLFDELLELSAVEFWSYSMISCAGYPLLGLDSIASATKTKTTIEQQSALSIILQSNIASEQQKSALLSSPVIKRLLEEKWKLFGFGLFVRQLLTLLLHLSLFTASIILRPHNLANNNLQQTNNISFGSQKRLVGQLLCEFLTWFMSLFTICTILMHAVRLGGLRAQLVSVN